MKKLLLTSLLAVFAVSGAQAANYFVGGSAALNLDDSHSNNVMVAPEFGWYYNENWDFGANVLLGYDRIDANNGLLGYGVGGFARYKVAQFGDFKLLLKGTVGVAFETQVSDNEAIDGDTDAALGLSVAPMVTYDVSDSLTLYANLNFLSVSAGYTFENDNRNDAWLFKAGADSSDVFNTGTFQVGFFYNF